MKISNGKVVDILIPHFKVIKMLSKASKDLIIDLTQNNMCVILWKESQGFCSNIV